MVIYQMVVQNPLIQCLCFVYRYIFTCLFCQNQHVTACIHSKIFYEEKRTEKKNVLTISEAFGAGQYSRR